MGRFFNHDINDSRPNDKNNTNDHDNDSEIRGLLISYFLPWKVQVALVSTRSQLRGDRAENLLPWIQCIW